MFTDNIWSEAVEVEVKKLEFNFGIKIDWDGNNWTIRGYEWTFSNLDELREFCRRYL